MADEITLNLSLRVENGNFYELIKPQQMQFDQTAQGADMKTVSVTTAEASITVSGVTTLGWLYMRNLSTGNSVTYGPLSTATSGMISFGQLDPDEPAMLRLKPGITIRAVADTTTCLVDMRIFQD